jgi:threonine/homoserine/homoserine lactone efflux protein
VSLQLNPKGIVFFVAFLPQFVDHGGNVTQQLWLLAVTFVCMAVLNVTLYAMFATSARSLLASPRTRKTFNLVGGSLLVSAGLWSLFAKRPT